MRVHMIFLIVLLFLGANSRFVHDLEHQTSHGLTVSALHEQIANLPSEIQVLKQNLDQLWASASQYIIYYPNTDSSTSANFDMGQCIKITDEERRTLQASYLAVSSKITAMEEQAKASSSDIQQQYQDLVEKFQGLNAKSKDIK